MKMEINGRHGAVLVGSGNGIVGARYRKNIVENLKGQEYFLGLFII